MLTLFTMPKPFVDGHIADIQHNALASWTRLANVDQIILLGDEQGTREAAQTYGAQHIPDIPNNAQGTPLLNAMFAAAENHVLKHSDRDHTYTALACVNADILLLDDFSKAIRQIAQDKKNFLISGRRTDYDQIGRLSFDGNWQQTLRQKIQRQGQLQGPPYLDFFVFNQGLWGPLPQAIPPFALGRFSWDNWLIYRARQLNATVIDATQAICTIHQNHHYNHAGGAKQARFGPEAKQNLQLAGGNKHLYTIWDATHILTPDGLRLRQSQDGDLGGGIWTYRRSGGFRPFPKL